MNRRPTGSLSLAKALVDQLRLLPDKAAEAAQGRYGDWLNNRA